MARKRKAETERKREEVPSLLSTASEIAVQIHTQRDGVFAKDVPSRVPMQSVMLFQGYANSKVMTLPGAVAIQTWARPTKFESSTYIASGRKESRRKQDGQSWLRP